MKTRTERALVALAILGLTSCSSSEGDAGAGGSTDDADSTATGTTGSSSSSSSSSNGSGAADGGGGSGGAEGTGGEGGIACPAPPDPAVCEAHNNMPGTACGADGCLSAIFNVIEIVDGECRPTEEVFGCLSVDQCAADPDAPQTYWRDDTVISWGLHCGLQGWTPCDGSPGEPEACACEDFNPGLCDAP